MSNQGWSTLVAELAQDAQAQDCWASLVKSWHKPAPVKQAHDAVLVRGLRLAFDEEAFDPAKHPRGGFPANTGEFSPGAGGGAAPEAPELDPEVVGVGGDPWNKQTAVRLETEYQTVKPALEKIIGSLSRVLSWGDVPEESQAVVKAAYVKSVGPLKTAQAAEDWLRGDEAQKQVMDRMAKFIDNGPESEAWLRKKVGDIASFSSTYELLGGKELDDISKQLHFSINPNSGLVRVKFDDKGLTTEQNKIVDDFAWHALLSINKLMVETRKQIQVPTKFVAEGEKDAAEEFDSATDDATKSDLVKSLTPDIWEAYADQPAVEPSTNEPDEEDKDEEDEKVAVDEWDMLSNDQQEETKSKWIAHTEQNFLDSEISSWPGYSLSNAHEKMAKEFNDKGDSQWAFDAINDITDDNGEPVEFPLTPTNMVDCLTITTDDDSPPGDPTFEWNDDEIREKMKDKVDNDPQFEGFEPQDAAKLFPEDKRKIITDALLEAFNKEAEKIAGDMEPPDFSDQVSESQELYWDEMSDDDKFEKAKDYLDSDVFETEAPDDDDDDSDVKADDRPPSRYDPLDEVHGIDYARTQAMAHKIFAERAMALVKERGIHNLSYVSPEEKVAGIKPEYLPLHADQIKERDNSLWLDWLSNSATTRGGQAIQVATADELGGRIRDQAFNPAEVRKYCDDNYAGGFALIKAMIRAKWETTQILLERAGVKSLNLYRAVNLEIPEVSSQLKSVKGYTQIPRFHVDRNGAASTSTKAKVSNKWDGASGRVVLRAHVPRTGVISVPAYGNNTASEYEVVVAGTAWHGWDAWLDHAPEFKDVPLAKAA